MSDRPTFTDADAAAAWDEGADAWDQFVESGADFYRLEVHGPALLDACEPLRGLKLLDLGCGEGYFSRLLARRGAHVAGVDLSARLLARARDKESREPLGIEYHELSALRVAEQFAPGSVDLVAACMSIQDMSDVAAVLRSAFVVLRSGGRLVFSVPHPATEMPFREWKRDHDGSKRYLKLDRYFETGPAHCAWNMARLKYLWATPYWRYTLSEWTGLIRQAASPSGSCVNRGRRRSKWPPTRASTTASNALFSNLAGGPAVTPARPAKSDLFLLSNFVPLSDY